MISRRKRDRYRSEREVFNTIPSLTPLLRPLVKNPIRLAITPPSPQWTRHVEDRRRYSPTKSVRPPAAVIYGASRVVAKGNKRNLTGVRFALPDHVAMCARRKIRRNVLHALRIAGKRGVGKGKPRHTNFWSSVSCKRGN